MTKQETFSGPALSFLHVPTCEGPPLTWMAVAVAAAAAAAAAATKLFHWRMQPSPVSSASWTREKRNASHLPPSHVDMMSVAAAAVLTNIQQFLLLQLLLLPSEAQFSCWRDKLSNLGPFNGDNRGRKPSETAKKVLPLFFCKKEVVRGH